MRDDENAIEHNKSLQLSARVVISQEVVSSRQEQVLGL